MAMNEKEIKLIYRNIIPQLNENEHLTTIENLEEIDVGECLKILKIDNKNVNFNKAIYSKKNKKMYIYSNEPIEIKEWGKLNLSGYEEENEKNELINKVNKVLGVNDNIDTGCISLYDVMHILAEYHKKFDEAFKQNQIDLNNALKNRFGEDAGTFIVEFDYDKEILGFFFKKDKISQYKRVVIVRQDGDLRVLQSESPDADEILNSCRDALNKCYNFRFAIKNYTQERVISKELANEKFYANIYCRSIYLSDKETNPNLKIIYDLDRTFYTNVMNFGEVGMMLEGKNALLFKKLYINIKDLPSWLKEGAYTFRISQV